jgi:hypothetical protein
MFTIQDTQKDNSFAEARKQTEEYKRLQEVREQNIPWKKWGPYLSDRQWATVREDYSQDGTRISHKLRKEPNLEVKS